MRFFSALGILFYATVLIIIGVGLVVYSLGLLGPQDLNTVLTYVQSTGSSRMILGLSGFLLILISFSFAQLILGHFQKEKNIAFNTASGEVTIALSAVEDLIKRLAGTLVEIKELRPDVIATKKGILVDIRVVLKSEANIPELTERLQNITRQKIQEVLGIDEQIMVKIHVTKIITVDEPKKKKDFDKPEAVPFGGYGRV